MDNSNSDEIMGDFQTLIINSGDSNNANDFLITLEDSPLCIGKIKRHFS
ncbi:MAG: hypothetical protein ACJA13_003185 [Paraglaciecola sp.]|jgi:hypothetical protein